MSRQGWFRLRSCKVFVTQDKAGKNGGLLWHLSISHPHRYPKWDEIRDARYKFLPTDLTFGMLLPPPEEYVNVHPNCFHLWEITDPRGE